MLTLCAVARNEPICNLFGPVNLFGLHAVFDVGTTAALNLNLQLFLALERELCVGDDEGVINIM